MTEVKLIIFDFDGVVVDSECISSEADAETLQMFGIDLTAEQVNEQFIGVDAPTMHARLKETYGAEKVAQFVAHIDQVYKRKFEQQLQIIPHVLDFISTTKLPICIASNSTPDRLAISQKITKITRIFADRTFSASMVAKPKPAPDLFLYAAQKMGVAAQNCLVIEDGAHGIKAANDAGMRSIGFYGGSHCNAGHGAVLSAAGALCVFDDMKRLNQIIEDINNGKY